MAVFEGDLQAAGLKFAIVISRFNDMLSKRLLEGAIDALQRHGVDADSIDTAYTPGALEIPLAAKRLAASNRYDAIICLGVIIRGGTPHFEYVAGETSKGIAKVSADTGVPAIFGVVTADNIEQAVERSGTKMGNKGWQAAVSAIEMAKLLKELPK